MAQFENELSLTEGDMVYLITYIDQVNKMKHIINKCEIQFSSSPTKRNGLKGSLTVEKEFALSHTST